MTAEWCAGLPFLLYLASPILRLDQTGPQTHVVLCKGTWLRMHLSVGVRSVLRCERLDLRMILESKHVGVILSVLK